MSESGQNGPASRYAPDFLTELFRNPLEPGYADAARRRAEQGPDPAWRRRGSEAARTILLVATGFLLTVAYLHTIAAQPERARTQAGLVKEVKSAQERTDGLQQSADQLRDEVAKLQESALGGSNAELRRLRQSQAATGLAKVHGDGVVVELADGPPVIDQTTGKAAEGQQNRVLDVDLQDVVNGLWSAGAEAISINGQRLTAVSTIRIAGQAILVDYRPITGPYEVSAIGPPDLAAQFRASTAAAVMRSLVSDYGLQFSVHARSGLNLPAAGTDIPLHYARPSGSSTTAGSPHTSGGGG